MTAPPPDRDGPPDRPPPPSGPSYLRLAESGELARRARALIARLSRCDLCPRACLVDRDAGEQGVCRVGRRAKVSAAFPHFGEESVLVGRGGSGTIFFGECNLRCVFCQNREVSHGLDAQEVTEEAIAEAMLALQAGGCHNINLVTPTHWMPQILSALPGAIAGGLRLPLVYNCSGYEGLEALRLLDGVVDVYLPDSKYADDAVARRLSGFRGYVKSNRAALREMYRQVGPGLVLDQDGMAVRGMIVRHMVLPMGLAGTAQVLEWIARELSPDVCISLMSQYFPAYRAVDDPALGRRITPEEYLEALSAFDVAGLEQGWRQEYCEGEE